MEAGEELHYYGRMRLRPDTRLRLWLMALAAGGTVMSHWVAYRFLLPDVSHQGDLLGMGQQYWPLITAVAIGAVSAIIADVTCRHLCLGNLARSPGNLYVYAGVRLVSLQLGGFVLMELGEVFLSGKGLGELAQISILVGLSIQVVFALGAALLLIGLREAVVLVTALVSPRRLERSHREVETQVIHRLPPPRAAIWADARPLRAPPPN